MPNPLYQQLGGANAQPAWPFFDMQQMIQQFQQFKSSFKGDPKTEVMRLLQSGKISQAQLNQAQSMAQQMSQFMK